jgi:AcrR family transcriptional regulator
MATRRLPSDERKRQIVDAAIEIIATRGALYLTAAELGRAVGIADATVFRHFRDLDEVVLAAIEHIEAQLAGTFPLDAGDPMARLRAFFVARLALVRKSPAILTLATNDRLQEVAGVEGARRLRAIVARSHAFLRECITEAQARGAIDARLDPTVLEWVCRGTLQAAVAAAARSRGGAVPGPDEVWAILDVLLRARPTDRRAP